jgi:hypothetical protein
MREKPVKFLGTGHQCKEGYCHQLSIIFESVETFIRIVGSYLGIIPPICILVLSWEVMAKDTHRGCLLLHISPPYCILPTVTFMM